MRALAVLLAFSFPASSVFAEECKEPKAEVTCMAMTCSCGVCSACKGFAKKKCVAKAEKRKKERATYEACLAGKEKSAETGQ
jgi:hypothetical protein